MYILYSAELLSNENWSFVDAANLKLLCNPCMRPLSLYGAVPELTFNRLSNSYIVLHQDTRDFSH